MARRVRGTRSVYRARRIRKPPLVTPSILPRFDPLCVHQKRPRENHVAPDLTHRRSPDQKPRGLLKIANAIEAVQDRRFHTVVSGIGRNRTDAA